jgi:hypothetical protein
MTSVVRFIQQQPSALRRYPARNPRQEFLCPLKRLSGDLVMTQEHFMVALIDPQIRKSEFPREKPHARCSGSGMNFLFGLQEHRLTQCYLCLKDFNFCSKAIFILFQKSDCWQKLKKKKRS